MFNILKNYIDNMHHTIKKDQVMEAFDNTMSSIEQEVIPALDSVIADGDLKAVKDNKFLNNIRKLVKVRSKDNKDFLTNVKSIFKAIQAEEKHIRDLINKDLNDYVTEAGSTARDITIVKLITDIGSLTFYTMDLCYFLIVDTKDTSIPKRRLEDVREGVDSYISIVNTFNKNFDKYVKEIAKVADQVISMDGNPSMMDSILKSRGKFLSLPFSGFNGNPIYHIRMWLVDQEIERYELLKEKKKVIELKLLDLKLEAQNEKNPKLKTQIEYYEEKISKIEYNIKDIEDDEDGVSDYIPVVF